MSRKCKIKLVIFSFFIMALSTFVFFMWNFFICKSLGYIAVAVSLLVTEVIIAWPELKGKNNQKIAERLGFGLIGAVIWVCIMMGGIYLYFSKIGGPPINPYKPYKHKMVSYIRPVNGELSFKLMRHFG